MKKIVKIDIDGVVRDLEPNIQRVLQEVFPNEKVELKNPSAWDISNRYPYWPKGVAEKVVFETYAQEVFGTAKPYDGAKDFVENLLYNGYKIIFRTHQSIINGIYTLDWLIREGFPFDGYFFSGGHIGKNMIKDYILLDDNYENVMENPDKHIIFTRDWNSFYEDVPRRVTTYDEAYLEIDKLWRMYGDEDKDQDNNKESN